MYGTKQILIKLSISMKRLVILLLLTNIYSLIFCQEITREIKLDIQIQFETGWMYFRMQKNPLLSFEETHDEYGQWKRPSLVLHIEKFINGNYWPSIKISYWGIPTSQKGERYVRMDVPHLFLIEKGNGYTGIKKDYIAKKTIDSVTVNVYDSLFPYDNRLLVANDGWGNYTFHSGNVDWGKWDDVRFKRQIDMVGYVRGVQLGVDQVKYFDPEFSERIRQYRPDFPDYDYTESHKSGVTNGRLLIGAPHGKEDQRIEFIYYSNNPAKTGDNNPRQWYEMRYIMPTVIKSITERRWEVRKLDKEEMENFFKEENPLRYYTEYYRVIEPEIIIDSN